MSFSRNLRLALNLAAIALGMAMLAYASVPLYRLFCEMTGYGGTTQVASHAPGAVDRSVTVTFNADIAPNLAWKFKPGQGKIRVKIGEQALTYYTAENLSDKPVSGEAVYNVVPHAAGAYFAKIECFCFRKQTLVPRAKVDMPVSFYVDPAILDDPDLKNIETITLSYTFFEVKE